ncbi:putative Two-component system-sensor histidine kinase [Tenacibaculum sp. 190524A02b]|uniref:histidine kinase n=1 Tax=Tenacibaculum vairaonense TaxID=3137860 RepID=A0ABM9PRE7_9FLAO
MKKAILLLLLVSVTRTIAQDNQLKKVYDSITSQINSFSKEEIQIKSDELYLRSIQLKDTLYQYRAKKLWALWYEKQGDYNKAIEFLKEESAVIDTYKSSLIKDEIIVENYYAIAKLSRDKGDLIVATDYYYRSLELAKSRILTSYIFGNYNGLARIFLMQKNLKEARNYLIKAKKYAKSKKKEYKILNNLANINVHLKAYKEAKKNLIEARDLLKKDDYKSLLNNYNNLAAVYHYMGEAKTSLEYSLKSYDLKVKTNATTKQLAESLINISTSFVGLKNHKKAEIYMKKAESLFPDAESLELKKGVYKSLRDNYEDLFNYKKALHYSKLYEIYKDSLLSSKTLKETEKLRVAFETRLKDQKIESQVELIENQSKQKEYLVSGLIVLTILLISASVFYFQKIKAQKEAINNKDALNKAEMAKLIEEQKFKTFVAQVQGQHQERNRIAKDLHDSVSGNIAAIKMQLTSLSENHSKEMKAIINNLDITYGEVRTISHNLIKQAFSEQLFTKYFKNLLSLYQTKDFSIEIEFYPEERLNEISKDITKEISMIVQELVTNIRKHARTNSCSVSLTMHDAYLNVLVEDEGVGFDVSKDKKGIGLENVNSRVLKLKGAIEVDTVLNKGTTININIPVSL